MINVSHIERFATHDGPGIRTTVFLKGCPLHCPWCANPETWSIGPVLMHDEQRCVSCRRCEAVCPQGAVSFASGKFVHQESKCVHCGCCVNACLNDALRIDGVAMKESDVIEEVLKDRLYYEESGGGMTISGGEPFYQEDAVLRLVKLAKDAGLHVAAETTGNVSGELFRACAPYIDLFLFDLKHIDAAVLHRVTGGDQTLILSNLRYLLKERPQDVIGRVPVIPGFNQDVLEDLIHAAEELGIQKLNLLPYHSLGKAKWERLGRPYALADVPMMNREDLEVYASEWVTIGG